MADKARILVITGPGKGKTTAALGVILRSLAYGRKILLTRFCKASPSGELTVFEKFPEITVLSGDRGMTPPPDHPEYPRHVEAARGLFEQTKARAAAYDLIVMDEICGVTARGMISEAEVADFLKNLRPDQAAVLTGRGAGELLVAAADTVSEVECVKHGYEQGIGAQEGIEF